MATQSVRIGWRPYVNLTSVQAAANLLDSYSGAAAAYSLRKLKSSYTGSAIRVRRSSDNTELNIGFDSDGNLDTYSLSAFVGTGDGFVTTWYDQSGNLKNATQVTAAYQPHIVVGGTLQTHSGKPSLFFNGESKFLDCGYLNNGTKPANFSTFISANFTAVNQTRSIFSSMDAGGNGKDTYNTFGIHSATPTPYQMFGGAGGGIYYKYWRTSNVPTQSLPYLFEQHYKSNISPFMGTFYWNNTAQSTTEWFQGSSTISGGPEFKTSIGRSGENNGGYHQGFVQEIATYFSDQMSNRSGINTNLNTYYSVYPNPSSVWNLLTAAYNADTKSLPSLKTSLFAVYNGESNTNDSKGTNNGTAVGGLTYTTGKIGNAFTFNGTNAYVSLPNTSGQFNFDGDFTVSVWFRSSNLSASRYFMSNYQNNGTTYGYGWSFFYSGSLGWVFHLTNGANVNQVNFQSGYSANTWYHVVAVRKMGQKHKIYVNGVDTPAGQFGNVNTTAGYIANQKMDLGGISSLNLSALCDLDGVNMWNKALTQAEVSELYNSGNGAQYITNDFYKPTTNDALNTNNGTAVGGLTYGLGKVGTAFVFNGSNSAIRLPVNSMSFTNDFSISAWVNIPSGYTGLNSITILWNINGAWFSNPKGFRLAIIGTQVNFAIFNGTDTYNSLNWNDSNQTIIKQDSGWVHIAAVRKKSTSSKIYVNGVLKASNTDVNDAVYSSTYQTPNIGNVYMLNSSGTVTNNDTWAFNGSKIDGLSVWSKELTQTEITELYNSGNGKQYPN